MNSTRIEAYNYILSWLRQPPISTDMSEAEQGLEDIADSLDRQTKIFCAKNSIYNTRDVTLNAAGDGTISVGSYLDVSFDHPNRYFVKGGKVFDRDNDTYQVKSVSATVTESIPFESLSYQKRLVVTAMAAKEAMLKQSGMTQELQVLHDELLGFEAEASRDETHLFNGGEWGNIASRYEG